MIKYAWVFIILLIQGTDVDASDVRTPFPTLSDASGTGASLTKSQAGDASSGKIGNTGFCFQDASGNLILPQFGLAIGSKSIPVVLSVEQTYSAAVVGLVPVALATDVFTITGSASKTIEILQIGISATSTAGTDNNILLVSRSTADTGTSNTLTNVSYNTSNSAATAVVKTYTAANPTLGTLVGNIRTEKFAAPVVSSSSGLAARSTIIWEFGNKTGQNFTLQGTNQQAAINLNGATIAGANINIWMEWTEK